MKINYSIITGLCVAGILSLGVQAQDRMLPKKTPQLTMDDFDNRTAAPVSSSTPAVSNESSVATTPNKKSVTSAPPNSAASARAIAESAWDKTANLKSGKVEITYRPATGEGTTMVCEILGSDRMRVVKDDGEVIVIGATRYAKARGQG